MLTLEQKINNFSQLLSDAAQKLNCVFVEESGEGNTKETETYLLEDVFGWLIPVGIYNTFLASDRHGCEWDVYFRLATWKFNGKYANIWFDKN